VSGSEASRPVAIAAALGASAVLGLAARNRFILAGLERTYRLFFRARASLQALAVAMERRTYRVPLSNGVSTGYRSNHGIRSGVTVRSRKTRSPV
jgi:hypothetical protein